MKKTTTHFSNKPTKIKWKAIGKNPRHFLLTIAVICMANVTYAQYEKKSQQPTDDDRPYVVSITAGTTGIGAEGKKLLNEKLNLMAGFSFLPRVSFIYKSTANFDNTSTYSGNFSKAQLLLEYAPFEHLGIRLVGGGAYVFALKTNINREATGNYTYGDIVYTPSQIGRVDILADWKGPAAYAGLSFFRMLPRKRFNLTYEIGTYYLSDPKTSIKGTQMLAVNNNESNQEHWHENVSQYRWLPVLQLNFNYRLGKITAK